MSYSLKAIAENFETNAEAAELRSTQATNLHEADLLWREAVTWREAANILYAIRSASCETK